jgi:hypothetical protein
VRRRWGLGGLSSNPSELIAAATYGGSRSRTTREASAGRAFSSCFAETPTAVGARNTVSTQFWSVRVSTFLKRGGGSNARTGRLYEGFHRRTRTSISRIGAVVAAGESPGA